jgi:N-hydroxyarylamine O-acetyltransferase
MDVSAYLARIRYDGPSEPSLQTLDLLHRAHLRTVPFEDLDLVLKRPVDLSEHALFEKIVQRRRGGFCYELNGLFAALLRSLGFRVRLLSAQVRRQEGGFGPPFDHLALQVDLERPWLADVGYPRSSLGPLALDTDEPQGSDGTSYRIALKDDGLRYLVRQTPDEHAEEFRFDLEPRRIEDFEEMCRFHETSPASPFSGWLGCTLATADGRVTLSDEKLIVHRQGERTETVVPAPEIGSVLRDHFGIVVAHQW